MCIYDTQDNTTTELITEQSSHHLETNDEQVKPTSDTIIVNSDNLDKENLLTDTSQEIPTKHIENEGIDKSDNKNLLAGTTAKKSAKDKVTEGIGFTLKTLTVTVYRLTKNDIAKATNLSATEMQPTSPSTSRPISFRYTEPQDRQRIYIHQLNYEKQQMEV